MHHDRIPLAVSGFVRIVSLMPERPSPTGGGTCLQCFQERRKPNADKALREKSICSHLNFINVNVVLTRR
jgi:hypothetical protein